MIHASRSRRLCRTRFTVLWLTVDAGRMQQATERAMTQRHSIRAAGMHCAHTAHASETRLSFLPTVAAILISHGSCKRECPSCRVNRCPVSGVRTGNCPVIMQEGVCVCRYRMHVVQIGNATNQSAPIQVDTKVVFSLR